MPQFQSIEQAFEWFLENVFPELPPNKKYALRDARYSFYKEGKKVSEKRMKRILDEQGDFEIIYRFDKEA